MAASEKDRDPLDETMLVAIGASAGGLKAFEQFFRSMPPQLDAAFIVVPHLDPHRHSLMVELIGHYTHMPVELVSDGVQVRPNRVYVIPPNSFLEIHDGRLNLVSPGERRGVRMAIDHFFRSLANYAGPRAVCIVMSGTASDGALGLQAVKERGGLTVVQDPKTAEHDGMPNSAIATGCVDLVLPPAEMAKILKVRGQQLYLHKEGTPVESVEQLDSEHIDKILAVVLARTRHDFRNYKRGTMTRRILRRMGLRQIRQISDYVSLLREDEEETRQLFDDLLIGITQFYRDPEAFKALEEKILTPLIMRDDNEPLRIWVPGCSTGEEAYSVAISCAEVAARLGRHIKLQVFATDVDAGALDIARTARYDESIRDEVPMERLARYFHKEDGRYVISKQIREAVVFAPQNVIHDPPFSKLDLVSCRNLLIYLHPEVQHKIFTLFSYGLRDNRFLFLGSSETIGRADNLFATIDKRAGLFRKVRTAAPVERALNPFMSPTSDIQFERDGGSSNTGTPSRERLSDLVQAELLKAYAPVSVVVTEQFEVLYIWGSATPYLELPNGEPTRDLLSMARRGLRLKLRQAVRNALTEGQDVSIAARILGSTHDDVLIRARKMAHPRVDTKFCLIHFDPISDPAEKAKYAAQIQGPRSKAEESLIDQLESELKSTREELQGTIEELETSNEELKTSNEEALSMNEELQSTNEELETSKEELQSLNEELSTVNTELQEKLDLIESTNNDLLNLLASTDIATLILDESGKVRRFTPSAKRLFNLIDTDVGRSIEDITHQVERGGNELVEDAARVIHELKAIEDEVSASDGRSYIRRIAPYRTANNRIEGSVITYSDVTRVKQVEASLRLSEERYRQLHDNNPAMYFTLGTDLRVRSVNRLGADQLGYAPEFVIGMPFAELHDDSAVISEALALLTEKPGDIEQWEAPMRLVDGRQLWARGLARLSVEESGEALIYVVAQDITQEKQLTEQVHYHSTHDYLTGLLNRREFDAFLRRVHKVAVEREVEHSLVYVDIADFKHVNDTAGHDAGDLVLKQLGALLRKHMRKRDLVARLGGDEFGIILEYCPAEESLRLASEAQRAIQNFEFITENLNFKLDCYIGITAIDSSSASTAALLRSADVACHLAKQRGAGSIHIYDSKESAATRESAKANWVGRIQKAIDEQQIELLAEPVVHLASASKPVAYELHLAMQPSGDSMDASALISAAERYGVSELLDRYAIDLALNQLAAGISQLANLDFFAINLSAQSIAVEGYADTLETLVRRSGIPPKKLCFEVSERTMVTHFEATSRVLTHLHAIGCRIAIDEFGSGLSSLHYLRRLPCDLIKIDGDFVRGMTVDEANRSQVSAIHGLAVLLGITTVAESVDSEATDSQLRKIGINYRQGPWVGRMLPLCKILAPVRPDPLGATGK